MGLFDARKIARLFGQTKGSGKLPGKPSASGNSAYGNAFSQQKITEIDYNENNYDLFRSIYYNSVVNAQGSEYQIAAALGKPIVDIAAGYVLGRGFNVELDNPNSDALIDECEEEINAWLNDNNRLLFNIVKHSYRDGDAYLHIDEFGNLAENDAKGVEEIIDPITGETVGFDVKREVEIFDSSAMTQEGTKYVYVKQYRLDSIRIYRYRSDAPDSKEILWEKAITTDGYKNIERDEEGNAIGYEGGELTVRRLPVLALHNEPEPEAVYGNSDYQNLLSLFANYSGVIKNATKGAKYNAVPTLAVIGLQNPQATEQALNKSDSRSLAAQALDEESASEYGNKHEDKTGIEWSQDSVLYLSKGSDVKFINGTGFMDDLGKLLEYYFYLFVQGSETPEFIFGTAVSSSHASTDSQAPVFTKKIERKQMEFADFVKELVETYIERRAGMSDPVFYRVAQNMPKVRVVFPAIDNEDAELRLTTVEWLYENNLITSEKVLALLVNDQIKDISEELLNASKEAKKRAEEEPANSDRIVNELLSKSNTNNQEQTEASEGE